VAEVASSLLHPLYLRMAGLVGKFGLIAVVVPVGCATLLKLGYYRLFFAVAIYSLLWTLAIRPTRKKNSKSSKPQKYKKLGSSENASSITAGQMYELCTKSEPRAWFTISDCISRYSLVLFAHFWNIFTSPKSYFIYTVKYNNVWYGHWRGFFLSFCYPIMPIAMILITFGKRFKQIFCSGDWMTDGPGRVFFVKPSNPFASLIWDFYLEQSLFVGQFHLVGTDDDAIAHTWYDEILDKTFWSKTLSDVGVRTPRRLGSWDGKSLTMGFKLEDSDLVVKLPDSYLGIGDSFWDFKKSNSGVDDTSSYTGLADLKAKLQITYVGKPALVLEKVKPKKGMFVSHQPGCSDVHSIDIITVRTPDNDVRVMSVLLWADCTTSSSHSTRAGYTVDVNTETVCGAASWYSTYFASMETPLTGMKLNGIRDACAAAVQAHKNIEYEWLTVVGWDAMMMEKELVFFEGNYAGARTPRRIFLSSAHLSEWIRNFCWPWGQGASITPGQSN